MNEVFAAADAVRSAAARMLRPPTAIAVPAAELRFEDPALALARTLGRLLPERPSDQPEPVARNGFAPEAAAPVGSIPFAAEGKRVVDPERPGRVVETAGAVGNPAADSAVMESVERRDDGVRTQANAAPPGRARESVRLVRGPASLTSVLETAAGRPRTDAKMPAGHEIRPAASTHEESARPMAQSVRPDARSMARPTPSQVPVVDNRRDTGAKPVPSAAETSTQHAEMPSAPAPETPDIAVPEAEALAASRREATVDKEPAIDLDAITSEVADRLRDQLEWEFLRSYGTGELP